MATGWRKRPPPCAVLGAAPGIFRKRSPSNAKKRHLRTLSRSTPAAPCAGREGFMLLRTDFGTVPSFLHRHATVGDKYAPLSLE